MSKNPNATLNIFQQSILWISRIFVGLLFIFSGLIKANDPIGFGYKLQEYWVVFGTDFLMPHSATIAIVICALEILLGALLLLGFYRRIVAWGLLLLIIFFTFLTFYSAFFEVVTSCGCFGDAIPLTPWESFIKDLILLAFILVIFVWRAHIRPVTTDRQTMAITTAALVVISLGTGVYTYNFLPVIDFLPYKKGNNIPELMVLPEGAEPDQYEIMYTLKHQDTGEERTMSDQAYLDEGIWQDEKWEIIGEPTSRLLKKGYTVPITDLMIMDEHGEDHTQNIITNPYYNLIIVAYDLEATNKAALAKINELVREAATMYNIRAVLLTSASSQAALTLSRELDLLAEVFYADAVPLKSMVRANPGVMLMQNGVIIDKWHHHTVPDFERLEEEYLDN